MKCASKQMEMWSVEDWGNFNLTEYSQLLENLVMDDMRGSLEIYWTLIGWLYFLLVCGPLVGLDELFCFVLIVSDE